MAIEKMLTETEVAAMMGLTVAAIRQRRARKQPPYARKIGSAVRYPESEILALLESAPLAICTPEKIKPGRKKKVDPRPTPAPSPAKLARRNAEILEIRKQAEEIAVVPWVHDPIRELLECVEWDVILKIVGTEIAEKAMELDRNCAPILTPVSVTADDVKAWSTPLLGSLHAGIAAALYERLVFLTRQDTQDSQDSGQKNWLDDFEAEA